MYGSNFLFRRQFGLFLAKITFMKFHYKITSLLFFVAVWCYAQQLPLDFNSNNHTFNVFGEVASAAPPNKFDIFTNEQDGTDKVGRFFIDGSNPDPWQGFYIDLAQPINLDNNKILTLDFFKYDGDSHNVMIKLEQGGSNPNVEVVVNVTGGPSTWSNNLQFDFSTAKLSSDGTTVVNATGNYSRLTIFIDGGVANKPPGTFHFDDINDGSTATDPNALDVIYSDLVWSDEFDTDGPVDASKWHHQTFGPNGGQWFNGEQQHYTDSQTNSFVSGGFLNIVAKKESITQNGVTLNYSSARLNSKFAFTYGRVDVRAKLPAGSGTWPAIWTLGKNVSETGAYWQTQGFGTTPWPACGEIDIMEHGLHADNVVSSALHTPSSSGATVNTETFPLTDVANNYHVYSVNWSPNQITFLIDDVGYYTYNPSTKNSSTWPFDLDQFLLLNIAMGGFAGTIDPSFTQSSMVIDYVRVYQNTLSTNEEAFASKFNVYPNPSSGRININTDQSIDKVELYNTLGQTVVNTNSFSGSIDVDHLKTGIYLLRIYSEDRIATKRVMIK